MTKPFKLRLHLPSFQLCRSISSSVVANIPSSNPPLLPVNPKPLDIAYPKSPAPPPSSPNESSGKRNVASEMIIPIGLESEGSRSPAYEHDETFQKLYNSPEVSLEFDERIEFPTASNVEKSNKEGSMWAKDQSGISFTWSVSSADSGWFSSEDDEDDNEDGSEGQLSCCSSFNSSSCEFDHPVKSPIDHKSTNGNGSEMNNREGKIRRLRSYVSNSWKDGEKIKLATATTLPAESDSSGKKTVLGRLLPCVVDGKVNESYAIMKKSADPFEDFKMSMMEMIQEKQISEPEDLEKLLTCFLSLNAKDHHAVIVAAFTEVWEELYSSQSQPPN